MLARIAALTFVTTLTALAVLAPAVLFPSGTGAFAGGVYFDWNRHEPRLPQCDAVRVLSAVKRSVARADADYSGGLSIEDLAQVMETGYRKDRPSPLARRYCKANALTQQPDTQQSGIPQRRLHKVYYKIEEYQAFAGLGWNVEICVLGHDRWNVYDAWCRTVRP